MRTDIWHKRETCRLCDSPKLELVVPVAPTTVAEKYLTEDQLDQEQQRFPLDLYMCQDCGHVQILDVIDPKYLFDDYTFLTSNTKGLIESFEEYTEDVVRRFSPNPGGMVIDIGSNDGTLLSCFQKRGWSVLGIDPAKEIANQATIAGVETLPEFITPELALHVRQKYGPAAVVTANNVFAHADDLAGMADSIRALLADDGIFVFEISYLLDILDRMLLGTIFHEHLSHHSLKPMIKFLRKHGMEAIDVRRTTKQGGSLIGVAQLAGGPRAIMPSVPELLELEERRGLDKPETIREFSARLQAIKAKLDLMIDNARSNGQTIAGFGAARSGTTLSGRARSSSSRSAWSRP